VAAVTRAAETNVPETRDFFISFNDRDQGFAKWIDAVLRGAGFTTFAQFNDIKTGNDIPREMNRGLDMSARFVAVYSET
jgi:hypothetical protein